MGMRAFCVTRFAGNPVENVRCAPVHCHSTGSSNKKKSVSSFPRRQLIASIPALIALAECQVRSGVKWNRSGQQWLLTGV